MVNDLMQWLTKIKWNKLRLVYFGQNIKRQDH